MSVDQGGMKTVALGLAVVLAAVAVLLWLHPWRGDTTTVAKHPAKALPIDAKLAAQGKSIGEQNGCTGCHNVSGGSGAGPTWKGMYGAAGMRGGTVDVKYVQATLANPPGPMASFRGKISPAQAAAIAEYIKSLSQ